MKKTIGFIGLGMMGLPMVERLLQAGYTVSSWDINEINLMKAQQLGSSRSSSPRELAQECPVVITMLPSSKEVETVVLGRHGLYEGVCKGSVLIDMSTSFPPSTKEIAQRLAKQDASMLDAPVAGGVIGAKQGALCIMVGGEEQVYQGCLPLFKVFGDKIFYLGTSGSGHTMKIVSNYLAALSVVATSEAFALAVKAGLQANTVSEVLKISSGRNYSTEFKFPRYVLPRTFDDGFRLDLYVKDLNLAHEMAELFEVPMPISDTVRTIYQRAQEIGLGPQSHTNIVKMIEDDAKVLISG